MTTGSGGLQRYGNVDIFASNQKEQLMGTIITRSDKEVLHFFDEMKRVSDLIDHLSAENRHLLDGENYLTDTELAGKLKLSKRTLLDYRSSGILPYYQIGGKILYRESDTGKKHSDIWFRLWERLYHHICWSIAFHFIRVLYVSTLYLSGIPFLSLHIMAQHVVGRIAEHFPDVFFRNPVGQGDCRSERIAGHLGGQTLGNPT